MKKKLSDQFAAAVRCGLFRVHDEQHSDVADSGLAGLQPWYTLQ